MTRSASILLGAGALVGITAAIALLTQKKAPTTLAPTLASKGLPPVPPPAVPPTLDKGMPQPLAHAVAVALAREPAPSNLRQFGDAMKDYPIARGLLLAKAYVLDAAAAAKAKYTKPTVDAAIQAAIDAPTMDEAKLYLSYSNAPPTAATLDKVQTGRFQKDQAEKLMLAAVHDAARATGNITVAQALGKYPTVPRNANLLDSIQREKARLIAIAKKPSSYSDFEDNPYATLTDVWNYQDYTLPLPPIELVRKMSGKPLAYYAYTHPDDFVIYYASTPTEKADSDADWKKYGGNPTPGVALTIKSNTGGSIQSTGFKELHKSAGVIKADTNRMIAQANLNTARARQAMEDSLAAYKKQMEERAAEAAKHSGVFGSIGDALSSAVDGLGSAVDDAMKIADKIPGMQLLTAPLRAAEIGTGFLGDIATGKNVVEAVKNRTQELSDTGKALAAQIKVVAPLLSYVPGIGQGAALALVTAAGVAMGEPLSQIALDGVSSIIPGQPVSGAAFNAAVKATEAIVDGKPIDQVALDAAREGALASAGQVGIPKEAAGAAFDAGVALGKGKSLQDAGFAAVHDLVQGNDLAEKATNFVQAVADAKSQGKSVKDVLVDQAVSNVSKLGSDAAETQLRPLLSNMTSDPSLMNLSPTDLAKQANVPEPIAHAALAATKPVTDKIRVLDAGMVNKLLPNPPRVSPVIAELGQDPLKAAQVTQLAQAGNPNAKIVQNALDVANMAKQKQTWQAFYENLEKTAKNAA